MKKPALKIGFAGTMSDNFDGGKYEVFEKSITYVKSLCDGLHADFVNYPTLLLTTQDAADAAAFFDKERVDFLLVQTTTFPGGDMIVKLSGACEKIGLWALPEAGTEGSNFINSNNSFCGVNMFASILKTYTLDRPHPYKWFCGVPGDACVTKRLTLTIKALAALKKLAHSKVAVVGGIAPGFNDLYYDERLGTKRLGVEIRRGHEFNEIRERAYAYSEARVKELAAEYASGSSVGSDASDRHLEMSARYYQAYVDFSADYDIDALALSCWPQIKTDILACSVIGKLNDNGIAASCEGDLPGAVSQLFLHYLTGEASTMMDMAAYDEADDTVLMWHCGPAPASYANAQGNCLTCSYQLNIKNEVCPHGLINNLVLKPQPVTFMRFTGEWEKLFLTGGTVIDNKKSPDGSRGWVGNLTWNRKKISALDFTNSILVNGFEHHFPMMAGDVSELVMEASAWLKLKPMQPVEYQDYMQII